MDMTLRGLIVSRFGSVLNFSKRLGWSYSKTYRATKNPKKLLIADASAMCEALGVHSPEQIVALFFSARA